MLFYEKIRRSKNYRALTDTDPLVYIIGNSRFEMQLILLRGTDRHVWGVYGFLVAPSSTPDGHFSESGNPVIHS